MSNKNVDERVVEMRFENGQFESGVNQTLSSLDKLEQKLQFKGSEAGISSLESKVKNFDMSSMGNAAESVTNKFSALEVAGLAAIASIVNSATNAAIKFGKGIFNKYFIKPISDGFEEYELLQNTIQTIYTNTKSKGTTIEEIEAGLDELNKYADDTIYVMSDMTKAIGQFTNAGIGFADSKKAVVGFANLAAAVGATNEQLSRVEYQSSQALSAGVFRLMDWNSIQNSPLGGEFFQKALIKNAKEFYSTMDEGTAELLGTDIPTVLEMLDLMEEGAVSFRNSFNLKESLDPDWLRSNIFMETLKQFADDPELYEAATSVRTFTKMRETLEEAAGSGWAQTWKLIVGDFGESKALWTDVSKTLSLIIDGVGEARNEIIKFWKEAGGRDTVIQGLKNSMEALIRILKPIKEAFDEVLSPYLSDMLLRMSERFEDFTGKLLISENAADGIKLVFKGIFTVVKWILWGLEKVYTIIEKISGLGFKGLTEGSFGLLGFLKNLINPAKEAEETWKHTEDYLTKHELRLPDNNLDELEEDLDFASEEIDKFKDKLSLKEGQFSTDGLFGFGTTGFDKVKANFYKFGKWLSDIGEKIKVFFKNQDFISKDKITEFFSKLLEFGKSIPDKLEQLGNKINDFWKTFKQTPEFQSLVTSLKNLGTAIWNIIKLISSNAIDLFNKFMDNLKDPEKRAERAKNLADALDSVANALKWIADAASSAIDGMKGVFDWIGSIFGSSETAEIDNTTEAVENLAEANTQLVDSQKKGSVVKPGAGGMMALGIGLNIKSKDIDKTADSTKKWLDVYNEFVKAHGGKSIEGFGEDSIFEKIFGDNAGTVKKVLAGIALAGTVLTAIVLFVKRYNAVTKLVQTATKIGNTINKVLKNGWDPFGLGALADAMSAKWKYKRFLYFAEGVALMAGAIALIAWSASSNPDTFWKAVAVVAGISWVLGAMTTLIGSMELKGLDGAARFFTSFALAVDLIAGAIAGLGYLVDNAKDSKNYIAAMIAIGGLVALLGYFGILNKVVDRLGGDSSFKDSSWKSILAIAGAIYIISSAISKLGKLELPNLFKGGVAIGLVMTGIILIVRYMSKIKTVDSSMFMSLASMVKSIALAILLISGAVALLSIQSDSYKPGWGLLYVAGIISALSAVVYAASKLNITEQKMHQLRQIGAAAVIFAVAVDLIAPAVIALSLLSWLNPASFTTAIVGILLLFGGISMVMAAASKTAKNTTDFLAIAASLTLLSAGVSILAGAIGALALVSKTMGDDYWIALSTVAGIITVFGLLAGLFVALPEASVIVLPLLAVAGATAIFGIGVLVFAKAVDAMASAVKKLIQVFGVIHKATDKDLDTIKKNIIKFFENFGEVWVAFAGSIVAGAHVFADAFKEIVPIIEPVIDWFADKISKKIDNKFSIWGNNLGPSLGNIILKALKGLISFLAAHTTDIYNILDSFVALITKVIAEALTKIFINLNILSSMSFGISPFDGIIENLKGFTNILDEEIVKLTGFDFRPAADNISNGMGMISDALNPQSEANLVQGVEWVPSINFGPAMQEAVTFGHDMPGNVAGEITTQSSIEMPPAGAAIGEDGEAGLSPFVGKFGTLAQNMITSFLNAFLSQANLDSIYSATWNVGDTAYRGLADGSETHSPSRKAIYVAEMINKGLVDTLTASAPKARVAGYEYASSVVSGIVDGANNADIYNPSITPVLRSDSVTRQLSSMSGILKTTRTMSVATTAKLASQDAIVMRKAASDMREMNSYDDSKVVGNIQNLGNSIDKLGTSMKDMGIYMDSKKVGKIVTPTVNKGLYTDTIRKGRNN